jgi:hypothetical protein
VNPEYRIIELLHWAKNQGIFPRRVRKADTYLCPISRRLVQGQALRQPQDALWVPNEKGLKELGLKVQKGKIGPLTTMSSGDFMGAGPGEGEAALSLIQEMRSRLATAC